MPYDVVPLQVDDLFVFDGSVEPKIALSFFCSPRNALEVERRQGLAVVVVEQVGSEV